MKSWIRIPQNDMDPLPCSLVAGMHVSGLVKQFIEELATPVQCSSSRGSTCHTFLQIPPPCHAPSCGSSGQSCCEMPSCTVHM